MIEIRNDTVKFDNVLLTLKVRLVGGWLNVCDLKRSRGDSRNICLIIYTLESNIYSKVFKVTVFSYPLRAYGFTPPFLYSFENY